MTPNLQAGFTTNPAKAAGTGGTITDIIEVITNSIAMLRNLQNQVIGVDLIVSSITGQLTALKVALANIREWVDLESIETHHQLVIDLGDTLSCCGILKDRLNAEVSKLQAEGFAQTKTIFSGNTMENLQGMIERQTSALSLLITVYNW